jgi:hypothetical protein
VINQGAFDRKRRTTVLEHRRTPDHSHIRGAAMADKDDTSKVPPDRNSRVSAETSASPGDRTVSKRPAITRIERAIEAQRAQLLQAHGVLTCLYEVLLYAEGDDAVDYAQAAHAAAMLINKSVEDLDSVRTRPMIEELVLKTGMRVEDSAVSYWR